MENTVRLNVHSKCSQTVSLVFTMSGAFFDNSEILNEGFLLDAIMALFLIQ